MFVIDAMTPTLFCRRVGASRTMRVLRGLRLTPAVMAAAWLAMPTICHASFIEYTLNASFVLNGEQETISNQTFLISDDGKETFEMQVTGGAPFAGLYFAMGESVLPDVVFGFPFSAGFNTILLIHFANDLSLAPDPISRVFWETNAEGFFDFSPTGEAVIANPEPASLAILGMAVSLFFLSLWVVRCARQLPSEG